MDGEGHETTAEKSVFKNGVVMPTVEFEPSGETIGVSSGGDEDGVEVEGDIGEVARYTGEPEPQKKVIGDLPDVFFKHPQTLSNEEMVIIADGLRHHIPLYAIAAKIKCGRNWLSRKIKEDEYLAEIWADSREAYIDNLEFQAKRLIDQGNPAMIMFGLERLGKSRGWGQHEEAENGEDDTKLVIGAIPEDMLSEANAEIEEKSKSVPVVDADGNLVSSIGIESSVGPGDPLSMAIAQEREAAGIPPAVPPTVMPDPGKAPGGSVDAASVSPPPYADQGYGGFARGPWDLDDGMDGF